MIVFGGKIQRSWWWPAIIIGLIVGVVFRKFICFGLLPIPYDLLVSFFFPFSSGGWEGYNSWTTHKEFIAADAIRQQLPWKIVALKDLFLRQLPLWNPHNFSGSPLLANFQAHALYPLNLIYWLLPLDEAWSVLILLQPLLAGLLMLLYLKEKGLGRWGALLASLAFAFSSYMVTWWEINVVGQTLIWLPLILWSIEKIRKNRCYGWLGLIIGQTFSVLGGHPLTALMVLFISIGYFVFLNLSEKKGRVKLLAKFILSLGLVTLITWPQGKYTLEYYQLSTLKQPFAAQVFDQFLLPIENLVTLFASDFFGNPATSNYWSQNYGDWTPYIGAIPFFFAILGMMIWEKRWKWFWFSLAAVGILGSIKSPLSILIKDLQLPIISSTMPARLSLLTLVSLAILAGVGLDLYLKDGEKWQKKFVLLWWVFGLVYLGLIIFSLGRYLTAEELTIKVNSLVSLKNLILPLATYLLLAWFLMKDKLRLRQGRIKEMINVIVVIGPTILGVIYYTNKYLPFAPRAFAYPEHPLIAYLQQEAGYNRYFGQETAYFGDNFASVYGLYSAEGYDVMVLDRYAQLMASVKSGQLPVKYSRSDVVLPNGDSYYRQRLFSLLGIRYILDKNDNPQSNWEPDLDKFPADRFQLVWQESKFKVYENLEALPRVFLAADYLVATKPEEIIKLIYDSAIDLGKQVILEENLPVGTTLAADPESRAEIVDYQSRQVTIKMESQTNQILFLSDNYYPGWKVDIDGQERKLYRADYSFRAVLVPAGSHQVSFNY